MSPGLSHNALYITVYFVNCIQQELSSADEKKTILSEIHQININDHSERTAIGLTNSNRPRLCIASMPATHVAQRRRGLIANQFDHLLRLHALSVCVLNTRVSRAKTAKLTEMPFGADSCGPKEPCVGTSWRIRLHDPCVAAMRLCVRLGLH